MNNTYINGKSASAGVKVKYFSVVLISAFLLAACQQEEKKEVAKTHDKQVAASADLTEKQSNSEEKSEPAAESKVEEKAPVAVANEHAGHNHDQEVGHSVKTNGEKFRVVEPQFACEAPVVIEFYAYQCPHCYNLEPYAEAWRKKNAGKVNFIAVPTHLGHQQFGSLLLVHQAAKKLGVLEKVQHALFERVHKDKKLFASADEAAEFLVAQGADKEKAVATLADEKAISAEIKKSFEMLTKYKVAHVPQILVNHQYMTDISSAGGKEELFKLVDELLLKENSCQPK
ncbi:thioredoxin domain-containing protein [Aliikangiella sp. IMCC44359]|uniref:thioredoxin domain-containing protein n=1 Tax=Aliikangiella sp. IMCC44359 TaxID=3459125 RepID=UPI00403AC729